MWIALVLAACTADEPDPREGVWAGTLELDNGGVVDFSVTVDVVEDERMGWWTLSATGSARCEGIPAGGTGVAEDLVLEADTLAVALDGGTADTSWDLHLDGPVVGDRVEGEGGFTWVAEADYTGDEMSSACIGLGEFVAERR